MIKYGALVYIWNPKKGDSYMIKVTPGASFGTHFAQINHDELLYHEFGEGVRTEKGDLYYMLRPSLGDYTRHIRRQTQIIFPKDAGYIIQHLNIFPGCTYVECGTGSGSLCCTVANFVGDTGKVCTYDRRAEFSELARKNAERWGVAHRIEFNVRELEEGFKERDADAVYIDIPKPWEHIDKAYEALKAGCHLGILVPTVNQIALTLEALEKFNFVDIRVCEIMLRDYKTDPRRIRPQDTMIGHTGYLLFAVKTLPLPERSSAAKESAEQTEEE